MPISSPMKITGVPGSENIRLHAMRRRGPSPPSIGASAPAQAVAVELHVLVAAEGGEDLLALRAGELVEAQLVVVAQEGRPRRCRAGPVGSVRMTFSSGSASSRASDSHRFWLSRKANCMLSWSPSSSPK